jgi:hypothetical protein
MRPQLETAVKRLRDAQRWVHRLAESLPEEKWSVRRVPASWSVAECVAHLNLTSRAYVPLLGEGLERARAIGGPAPPRYRMDLVGALISLAAGPMPHVAGKALGKAKTAPAFVPSGVLPREHLLAEFDRLQEELIAFAQAADGLPLGKVKVQSPFDARARYNLYACFVILPRHQMRHLEQAAEVWPSPP